MTKLQIIETVNAEIVETSNAIAPSEFTNEDELIIAWLGEKAESTRKTYLNAAKGFFEIGGGIKTTFTTLQNYRESLSQRYRVSTANKKLSAIKSLLRFATDMGYLSQNPANRVRSLKASKDKSKQSKGALERILSRDEVKALIANASTERDRAMMKTAYLLGLRIDELLNLHWKDFFDGNRKVKLVGKGSKERFVTVPASLVDELKALGKEGFIFQTYQGRKMTAVSAHKLLKKAITKAGLSKDISWHWFRHSCASHSLKNGASLESVRKKLGHSSISITNTYIHDDEDACLFLDI